MAAGVYSIAMRSFLVFCLTQALAIVAAPGGG